MNKICKISLIFFLLSLYSQENNSQWIIYAVTWTPFPLNVIHPQCIIFFSELLAILHWLSNSHKYLLVYGLFMKSLFRIFITWNLMNWLFLVYPVSAAWLDSCNLLNQVFYANYFSYTSIIFSVHIPTYNICLRASLAVNSFTGKQI